MPIVVDPDDCTLGTDFSVSTGNVWFNTTTLEIGIDPTFDANMDADGITMQALYSFAKETWQSLQAYAAFPFPFVPITDNSFEIVDGWDFEGSTTQDKTTRHLVKSAGWNVRNTSGVLVATWVGFGSLGDLSAVVDESTAVYIDQGVGTGTVSNLFGSFISDQQTTAPIDEPFLVYRDDNGDTTPDDDLRTTFNPFVREWGLTYAQSTNVAIGKATLENTFYQFPLVVATDIDISNTYADVYGTPIAPWSGMSIEFETTSVSESLGTNGPYDFGVTVEGNGATVAEIYEFMQAALIDPADIDATPAGTVQYGILVSSMATFVGSRLDTLATDTPDAGGTGVFINNFDSTQTSLIRMIDNTDVYRVFPNLVPIVINFGSNAVSDTAAVYYLFFTDGVTAGLEYGNTTAVLVQDSAASNIGGDVDTDSGYSAGTITRTYAYDDAQSGTTGGADVNVTLVVIGLTLSQYQVATGTITDTGVVLAPTPALERTYENP